MVEVRPSSTRALLPLQLLDDMKELGRLERLEHGQKVGVVSMVGPVNMILQLEKHLIHLVKMAVDKVPLFLKRFLGIEVIEMSMVVITLLVELR